MLFNHHPEVAGLIVAHRPSDLLLAIIVPPIIVILLLVVIWVLSGWPEFISWAGWSRRRPFKQIAAGKVLVYSSLVLLIPLYALAFLEWYNPSLGRWMRMGTTISCLVGMFWMKYRE